MSARSDSINPARVPQQQRGAALLLMMIVVLIAATAVLVTGLNGNDQRNRQLQQTQAALASARDALLAHALISAELGTGQSGQLVPDLDATGGFAEGEAHDTACGAAGVAVIGRLPWRTLGIAPERDAGGACLWYALSVATSRRYTRCTS